MTVSKAHQAPAVIWLRLQGYSQSMIADRLDCSPTYAYLLLRRFAPHLIGTGAAPCYTKRDL